MTPSAHRLIPLPRVSIAAALLFLAAVSGTACRTSGDSDVPALHRADEAAFADTSAVSVTVAEGLKLHLWAPRPLLGSPVAVSLDNEGNAYAVQTRRRKSSNLDIRQHQDWMTEDLALQSLDDKQAFLHQALAPSRSAANTWQEDLNGDSLHDWHDLLVESEVVWRIQDIDGDGRADVSNVFADGFNEEVTTGVAAGVLAYDGDIYMTVAPDLWRLRDTDGDGVADERTSVSHGYGIHLGYAGHDLSGLTLGPDGRIYWSVGDIGVDVEGPDGQRWAYPNEGAVMRANPDGSGFEVFAHGLRNPQELAFDEYGNLFSVDNDGDFAGEHERYVHILEGSDSGWRINWQYGKYDDEARYNDYRVWIDERLHVPHFSGQAAYITPAIGLAHDGPAGLVYNPGTALGPQWERTFFSSSFRGSPSQSRIYAFRLAPEGSSFKVTDDIEVLRGLQAVGMSFGPDGALYVTDWLDGWEKKDEGRIWTLDVLEGEASPLREETRRLLAEGMAERNADELGRLLHYADQRVRIAAQFELARRDDDARLLAAAEQTEDQIARVHGLWGLGQIIRRDETSAELDELAFFLRDQDPEIRAQTAKVLGDVYAARSLTEKEEAKTATRLINQLGDESARARLYAGEALGKLKARSAFDGLVALLDATGEDDPHLRHTTTLALARLGDAEALAALASSPSEDIRVGAVVALRQLSAPSVAVFLGDTSERVATEAARAIYDDTSITKALPALAAALETTSFTDEAFLRRAISANLRLGKAEHAQHLAAFAARPDAPEALRADALGALGVWAEPLALDRVDGRYRDLKAKDSTAALAALQPRLASLLAAEPTPVRIAAADAAGRLGDQKTEPMLYDLAVSDSAEADVRRAALRALGGLGGPRVTEAVEIALGSAAVDVRQEAQQLMGRLDLPEPTVVAMLETILENGTVQERQAAIEVLGTLQGGDAHQLLGRQLDAMLSGEAEAALQLDLLTAAEGSTSDSIKAQRAAYDARRDADDPLAAYRELLYGGDPEAGMRVVATHPAAQCIRCHQVNKQGGLVGPDLSRIGVTLSREQLLEALVLPSARLAPGYGTVSVTMEDGRSFSGTLMEATDSTLTLTTTDGTQTLATADIAGRTDAPSGMPPMTGLLTKKEIRDVVAFLSTLQGQDFAASQESGE